MCGACHDSYHLILYHCPAWNAGGGGVQLFNCVYIQNGLSHASRTFTNRLSAPNTTRYEAVILDDLPLYLLM